MIVGFTFRMSSTSIAELPAARRQEVREEHVGGLDQSL
jgi:hypothetical protein